MNARVFRNEVRRRLFGIIEVTPGIIITELAEHVGLSHSTVSYHMKILEEQAAVAAKRDGRIVRYYTTDQYKDLGARLEPLVKRERVRQILALIDSEPGLVPFNLAKRLEVSVPTIMWHLSKLKDYGALTMEKRNGHYDIVLSPEVHDMLHDRMAAEPLKGDGAAGVARPV